MTHPTAGASGKLLVIGSVYTLHCFPDGNSSIILRSQKEILMEITIQLGSGTRRVADNKRSSLLRAVIPIVSVMLSSLGMTPSGRLQSK
jgi:hypothetical protein